MLNYPIYEPIFLVCRILYACVAIVGVVMNVNPSVNALENVLLYLGIKLGWFSQTNVDHSVRHSAEQDQYDVEQAGVCNANNANPTGSSATGSTSAEDRIKRDSSMENLLEKSEAERKLTATALPAPHHQPRLASVPEPTEQNNSRGFFSHLSGLFSSSATYDPPEKATTVPPPKEQSSSAPVYLASGAPALPPLAPPALTPSSSRSPLHSSGFYRRLGSEDSSSTASMALRLRRSSLMESFSPSQSKAQGLDEDDRESLVEVEQEHDRQAGGGAGVVSGDGDDDDFDGPSQDLYDVGMDHHVSWRRIMFMLHVHGGRCVENLVLVTRWVVHGPVGAEGHAKVLRKVIVCSTVDSMLYCVYICDDRARWKNELVPAVSENRCGIGVLEFWDVESFSGDIAMEQVPEFLHHPPQPPFPQPPFPQPPPPPHLPPPPPSLRIPSIVSSSPTSSPGSACSCTGSKGTTRHSFSWFGGGWFSCFGEDCFARRLTAPATSAFPFWISVIHTSWLKILLLLGFGKFLAKHPQPQTHTRC